MDVDCRKPSNLSSGSECYLPCGPVHFLAPGLSCRYARISPMTGPHSKPGLPHLDSPGGHVPRGLGKVRPCQPCSQGAWHLAPSACDGWAWLLGATPKYSQGVGTQETGLISRLLGPLCTQWVQTGLARTHVYRSGCERSWL